MSFKSHTSLLVIIIISAAREYYRRHKRIFNIIKRVFFRISRMQQNLDKNLRVMPAAYVMDTTTFLNYTLSFTITFSAFWAVAFWTGSPNTFNAIFGRDSTPIEASGYKYTACSNLGIVLGALSALFRSDLRKREALRIGTFVWLADLITVYSQKEIYNEVSYYILVSIFSLGVLASFMGGFVLKLAPTTKEDVPKPQIVEIPTIGAENETSTKHHQA